MDSRWILITLFLSFFWGHSAAQGPSDSVSEACNCEYTQQPPNELQCNPYQNSELLLECSVLFPMAQVAKNVIWFRTQLQSPSNSSETVSDSGLDLWHMNRLDNTDPNIMIREQSQATIDGQNIRIRSQLRITNLNDSFVGDYWCRIKTENGDWLVPSDSVYLQQASAYSHFGACSSQFAQSKQERKCASWDANSSVATTTLPPTPTTNEPAMVPTSDSTEASPRTESTTPSVAQGTTTDALPDVSSTGSTPGGTESSEKVPEGNPQPLSTELYVSISILVVFGGMVLVLAPATFYMCVKWRKRGAHPRPDLERVRPVELQRRSATMPAVASDYLVPQPFLGLTQEQLRLQSSRMHRPYSARHSYDTTLGFSHEYEDVLDLTKENLKPGLELVTQECPQPIYTNTNECVPNSVLMMKRNQAYRACQTTQSEKGAVKVELVEDGSDIIIPNPLYIHTPTGEASFSDGSNEYINQTCSSQL